MSNPAFFCYSKDDNVEALAGPSAIFVASYGNLKNAAFQRARERGAQVLVYRNALHVPDSPAGDEATQWFMGGSTNVPKWPYLAADGTPRSNWPGSKLIDIRAGSAWLPYMEDQIAQLIRSGLADGIFSDSHGARLWSKSVAWDAWTTEEQTEWALSSADVARRMDAVRRQVSERFLIVHNSNWILPKTHPAYAGALQAERYCDGVCLEHRLPTEAFHVAYAARPFNDLQQRRVIVIAKSLTDAVTWSTLPGVTHVASVDSTKGETYLRAVPVDGVAYNDIRLSELQTYAKRLELARASLSADLSTARTDCIARTAERDSLVQAVDLLDERLTAIAQIAEAPR